MTDQTPAPSPGASPTETWTPAESKRDAKARAKGDKAYRKAQRPWYKKKRFILPLLLVVLIALISALSGGDDEPESATPSTSASPSADATQDEATQEDEVTEDEATEEETSEAAAEPAFPGAEDGDVVGQTGDELTLGDVTLTAGALFAGDDTFGDTTCTTVSMNNTSEETVDFNAFDWSLQEPSGTITTTGFAGTDDQLSSGQIAPGGSTSGDVCFDAALGEGQYVVLYEPVFSFFSDRGAWVEER